MDKLFKIRQSGSTVGTEIFAGVTTFLTLTYILIVNPSILSATGMPADSLFTATALGAIVGTFLVAVVANLPFAMAPGMGVNAFFAFALVLGQGYSWQDALTMVLISGALFLLAGVLGLRQALLRCFPEPLKYAVSLSIGLMIAYIGLKNVGLLVYENGFFHFGDVTNTQGPQFLALVGIIITGILIARNVYAAVLVGIILTTIIGLANGQTNVQPIIDKGIFSLPPSIAPISFAFNFDWEKILSFNYMMAILTLFAVDIFDSLGTMVGISLYYTGDAKKTYDERIPSALMCDAAATVVGACFGTSTVTTYVESSAGVAAGGRTGLTSLTTVVLFAAAMFIFPLFSIIPGAATVPALIVVGMYMAAMSRQLNFQDPSEGLPAVLCALVTTMTMSISDGLMFAWLSYTALKLFSGKKNELSGLTLIVALFFLIRLVYM